MDRARLQWCRFHKALLDRKQKTYCAVESGVNSVVLDEAWELGLGICCRHQVWFMSADQLAIFGHHNIALNEGCSLKTIQGEDALSSAVSKLVGCRAAHSCLC